METPNIEESRRIAEELESNERKRGARNLALPDMPDFAYDFFQDGFHGNKDRVINGLSVLVSLWFMALALSKGTEPVGAAILSFVVFIISKAFGYIAFAILELAVEYWGWVLVIGMFVLWLIFG